MRLEIILANPSGNVTALITSPVPMDIRPKVTKEVMDTLSSAAVEQVGFIAPPCVGGEIRLEMMGGEFCGNATRSVALLAAKQTEGVEEVLVECSGQDTPLTVTIDHAQQNTFLQMPLPLYWESLNCGEYGTLGLVVFQGISHIIALDIPPSSNLCPILKEYLPKNLEYQALGVLFYYNESLYPYIEVPASKTLILEGSCGSGTTALALWLSRQKEKLHYNYHIPQPKGTLVATVTFQEDRLTQLTMGGKVTLSPSQECNLASL